MAKQEASESHDYLVTQLRGLLGEYEERSPVMSLREQATFIVRIQDAVRQLGIAVGVRAGFSQTSAKDRIQSYLHASTNQVVEGMELAVIAGISEYGRRVREIRQSGFKILTGPDAKNPITGESLRPDQYLLTPDENESHGPFR